MGIIATRNIDELINVKLITFYKWNVHTHELCVYRLIQRVVIIGIFTKPHNSCVYHSHMYTCKRAGFQILLLFEMLPVKVIELLRNFRGSKCSPFFITVSLESPM